jgi:hypothetical protein
MSKQKRDEQPSEQPERELPPGVKLLRILEGHKDQRKKEVLLSQRRVI